MAKILQFPGASSSEDLLQLTIELAWLKPLIWRKVLVLDSITLVKLHQVIQTVMGWTDSHLHEFEIAGKRYGMLDPAWNVDDGLISEKRKVLANCLSGAKSFRYTYDFGDDWGHHIKVEKALSPEAGSQIPLCLAGANACPPEDVGGAPGYIHFIEAISNPHHPEHKEMMNWVGGRFDPKAFDLTLINNRLRRIKV